MFYPNNWIKQYFLNPVLRVRSDGNSQLTTEEFNSVFPYRLNSGETYAEVFTLDTATASDGERLSFTQNGNPGYVEVSNVYSSNWLQYFFDTKSGHFHSKNDII